MILVNRYAVDTVALISYFNEIFNEEPGKISDKARDIIKRGFSSDPQVKLIVPSVVLMEIFRKFLTTAEFNLKFKYEVFDKIKESPDIEIKPIEKEVLECFLKIDDKINALEHNDKLILASAMQLDCPLITNDPEIIKYVKKDNVIPNVIS